MEPLDYLPEYQNNPLKDNSKRAETAIAVFWGIVGISFVGGISCLFEYELLGRIADGGDYTQQEAEWNDMRQGIIALAQTCISIASIVVFLNWFRRAYGNLHRVGNLQLAHEETWTIWGFVIPIISLWYPFKIMKEVWLKTQFATKWLNPDYRVDRDTSYVGLWWAAYLVSNFAGQISFRFALRAEEIGEIQNATMATIVSDLVDVPAALVTLFLIKKVSEKEKALYREMGSRPAETTPSTDGEATTPLVADQGPPAVD